MRKKQKFNFTFTPEIYKEFQEYASSIGSNSSYELERLIRQELKK